MTKDGKKGDKDARDKASKKKIEDLPAAKKAKDVKGGIGVANVKDSFFVK